MEMNYNGVYGIGATHPGVPLFLFAKTNHFTWAITAALTDLSDLFKETLNPEKTKYFVDNEWRSLTIEKELIKVKDQTKPVEFVIRHSHRGPLVDGELLSNA